MASVRAIVPNTIPDSEIFFPLTDALSRYPSDRWELIIGTAEHADLSAKTVTVAASDSGAKQSLSYDQLVLATGSRVKGGSMSWKPADTHETTMEQLHATRERVATARHIMVAGAGPTGVEVAGELGFAYGTGDAKKEVILLASGESVLGGDSIAASAASELAKLGVQVRTGARVEDVRTLDDGRTEVKLVGGEAMVTDLYLPTMGLTPCTEYMDPEFLTDRKTIIVDECFRVKGAQGVWAVGDVVAKPRAGYLITQKHAAGVAKNVDAVLRGKQPTVVKGMPVDLLACAVGRRRGVGRAGFMRLLSFMVYMAKGKTLGVEQMKGYTTGAVA